MGASTCLASGVDGTEMMISPRLLFVLSLAAGCEPAAAPAVSVSEQESMVDATPRWLETAPAAVAAVHASEVTAEQVPPPAAPLGEVPPVNASAQRSEVEPAGVVSPRFMAVDTPGMLQSMAAVRRGHFDDSRSEPGRLSFSARCKFDNCAPT